MIPVEGIIKGATSLWTAVFGDRSQRDTNEHARIEAGLDLDKATLAQFSSEFSSRDRSWWGSLINGMNRLPRPLFALGVLAVVFIWSAYDLASFVLYTQGLAAVPEGFWALVAVIVGFYFGGRMQLKSQQFKQSGGQLAHATAVLNSRGRKTQQKASKPWINPDTGKPMGF